MKPSGGAGPRALSILREELNATRVQRDRVTEERDALAEQLERTVEALRFYADPKTWDTLSPHGYVTANTLARQDGGERARRALGGQPDA